MNGFYWLASYPKSGNTWLRLWIESLTAGGKDIDINANKLVNNVANRTLFDDTLDIESADLTANEIARVRPLQYQIESLGAKQPLLRKVHDAWGLTPAGTPLFPPELTLGAIYIVRDPRDVAVSFAHHMSQPIDKTITFMANPLAMIAKGRQLMYGQLPQHLSSWSLHVDSWLNAPIRCLLLKYENMLNDPLTEFEKVAGFLKLDATPAMVEAAINAVSFERLRAKEETSDFIERLPGTARFFRRGIAGGWQDSLTPAQVARIEVDHGTVMRQLAYL